MCHLVWGGGVYWWSCRMLFDFIMCNLILKNRGIHIEIYWNLCKIQSELKKRVHFWGRLVFTNNEPLETWVKMQSTFMAWISINWWLIWCIKTQSAAFSHPFSCFLVLQHCCWCQHLLFFFEWQLKTLRGP